MDKSYDPKVLRKLIEKTLKRFDGLYSPEAVELLMGTCAQESALGQYRHQINGPAHGIFQIERATFEWLKQKYKRRYPEIEAYGFEQLIDSDVMSIVMARLKYFSCPGAIPKDLEGQSKYYKKFYNSPLGAATTTQYVSNYKRYIGTDEEYLANHANYVKDTEVA